MLVQSPRWSVLSLELGVWNLELVALSFSKFEKRPPPRCIPKLSVDAEPAPRGGTRPTTERTRTVGPVPSPGATRHRQLVDALQGQAASILHATNETVSLTSDFFLPRPRHARYSLSHSR